MNSTSSLYTQALINEEDWTSEQSSLSEAETRRTLAELLNISEDELPENIPELRAELAQLFSDLRRDAEKSENSLD